MNVRYQVRFIFEVVYNTKDTFVSVVNSLPFLKKTNSSRFESTHKISCNKYFYVWAETKDEAKEIAKKEFECFLQEENIKLTRGYIMQTSEDKVISTNNGHNKDLVDKINYIWVRNHEDKFKPIIYALFQRDKDEAEEKGITWELSEQSFESFMYEFIMCVCDDVDLEVIINFIRHREVQPNGDVKILYSCGWV